MTEEVAAKPNATESEVLRGMAAVAGVSLSSERAATLAPQAEQHFAQLRFLDEIVDPSTESAAELRLDRWTRPSND